MKNWRNMEFKKVLYNYNGYKIVAMGDKNKGELKIYEIISSPVMQRSQSEIPGSIAGWDGMGRDYATYVENYKRLLSKDEYVKVMAYLSEKYTAMDYPEQCRCTFVNLNYDEVYKEWNNWLLGIIPAEITMKPQCQASKRYFKGLKPLKFQELCQYIQECVNDIPGSGGESIEAAVLKFENAFDFLSQKQVEEIINIIPNEYRDNFNF